ncbi:hypothetical protein Poli38472_005715 [Pythium oligandrum]|uniref:Uncharacterized protein n=1 Tax=Pythium oligandrum TaxID=41045 RepID=A0A8K1CT25_PYTOL|nr:hypothetical protein Poli38472_005715 [Pythium oligandrum]|eukprot:TMW68247.1 hypothetical protein Poli38472_005715 [Pythium oligandrum]
MVSLRSASVCVRSTTRRPRQATMPAMLHGQRLRGYALRPARQTQMHCELLVRAFSTNDASDPLAWQQRQDREKREQSQDDLPKINGLAHPNGSASTAESFSWTGPPGGVASNRSTTSLGDTLEESHDLGFTASRIGFPAYDESGEDDDTMGAIREESREEATAKAERILAILRHSMTELDIGRVIHRISQYATTPRVTQQTRKQFLKSLEARFGPEHQREHELVLAFLLGQDHVIEQLKVDSRRAMDDMVSSSTPSSSISARVDSADDDHEVFVPEIMGLHPELVADPKFIGVVFCYCRMACLNSQKLVRPPHGQHRLAKSSLLQVKHDFRRVLDSEGLSHFAEMMGIKADPIAARDELDLDSVDAEWDEFNLENDRIDFRMLVAETQELITLMKELVPDETITKMLIAMLASLKTTKLHRKIFQEIVCNIQALLPEHSHEAVLSKLVPFLSGNQATYKDFESESASAALQHHRLRHEAILRALLEARMRLGHILIHDLDAIDPTASISSKLPSELREKVITAAWNIVSVLNDREYHVFFSRFLKHKLAWRPSRTTFGETFLDDVRKTLGPRKAEAIMPLFEEVFPHLSVETLTICRVKLRHSKKLLREPAQLSALNEIGQDRLESTWQPERSVFYRNLPHGVTERHLRAALDHIGRVKRFVFFSNPVNGAPDELDEDEDEEVDEIVDEDEDGQIMGVNEDDDEEEDDDDFEVLSDDKYAEHKSKINLKDLKTPRRKTHVIASDKKTSYNVLVEFANENGRDRALQRALQIFGVMMSGWKEYRPVFSSPADERTSISIQNIPFGTSIDALLSEVNGVLAPHGLSVDLAGQLPRGVVLTNGRIELRFNSFRDAAHVVELLNAHVARMKSRRPLSGDDLYLEIARDNRRRRQEKVAKAEERKAKRVAKKREDSRAKAAKKAKAGRRGESEADVPAQLKYHLTGEEDEDALVEDEDDDDAEEDNTDDVDESEDAYFAWEDEVEARMTEEEYALREVLRPFDVTWNQPPRPKNKHMYV